jgi:hypothetical protein
VQMDVVANQQAESRLTRHSKSSRFDLQTVRRRSCQVDDGARVAWTAVIGCQSLVDGDGRMLAVIPRE